MEQIDKVLEIDILGGIKMMQSISAYCNYTIGHGNGNFGPTLWSWFCTSCHLIAREMHLYAFIHAKIWSWVFYFSMAPRQRRYVVQAIMCICRWWLVLSSPRSLVLLLIGWLSEAVRYGIQALAFYCHRVSLSEGCPWLERPPARQKITSIKTPSQLCIKNTWELNVQIHERACAKM